MYEFDLPADFVRGIPEVNNFLSNKINQLERHFDMIGTGRNTQGNTQGGTRGSQRFRIHMEENS